MSASVMKNLFLGELATDVLWPYPRLEGEDAEVLAMFRESLARFAKDHIDAEQIQRDHRIPDEVLDGLGELGVFGMLVPEEFDGLGLNTQQYVAVSADLMAYDGPVAVTSGGHSSIGIKGLLLHGTDEQRRRYLPRLASGEMKAAFALSEAGAGSDAQALKTTARLDEDGTHYVIDGEKLWITNGGFADLFTVFARTPDHPRDGGRPSITAFLVERGFGVQAGPEEDKLGLLGSSTVPLLFEGVRVPRENVLGEVGRGFKVALEVLNSGRLTLAGNCLGASRFLVAQTAGYTNQREQFGRPISDFELIREKLGRMALDVHALDAMVGLTAGRADEPGADVALEAAACKVIGTETLWSVVNDAVQCAGGNGFTTDYPYARMMRDARVNMIFEGTNEILRMMIAGTGVRQVAPRLAELPVDDGPGGSARRFAGSETPDLPPVPAPLRAEAVALAMGTTTLAQTAAAALRTHGDALGERQLAMGALADQAIALYAMGAVLSRASDAIEGRGEDAAADELQLARATCRRLARRARASAASLSDNDDEDLLAVAASVVRDGGLPGAV